ncbi:MAG: hypothetical protein RLZZ148_1461 [Cyanobacteriota bacterium]
MMKKQDTTTHNLPKKLGYVFEDIVHKVEIKSDFSIFHPEYKPILIPEEVRENFDKMPPEMQQKYLSSQLRGFLYGIYYNGSLKEVLNPNSKDNSLPKDLENNTFLGMDVAFYDQLHKSNNGSGYFDSSWQILQEESDGSLVVSKEGLRIYIQPDKHLQDSEQAAEIGDVVSIKLPKNRVQNGFYMAVGNEGFSHTEKTRLPDTTVRIYWNFTPEGALAVMKGLDYQRDDAGVLYFDKCNYQQVRPILTKIYQETVASFKSGIPLFTLELAKGLGLAEEPNHRFSEQESFGTHRCQIIANGLLKAWCQGSNSPQGRMDAILEQFTELGLDLERVYLNANSEDIYKL